MESFSFREVAEVGGASSASLSSPSAMSARARFLVFLLCVLKMDDLILEGRARAAVVVEVDVGARRAESWLVNAAVEEVGISLARVLGRGMP